MRLITVSSELVLLKPLRRYHTVQEFNKGVYNYIIATDESGARGEQDFVDETEIEAEESGGPDECEYFYP